MNSSKTLLGILGGLAAGALLGILFAPEKGSKTRKKIINKSNGFVDDVKEKLDEVYSDIADKYENLLHDAKEMNTKKELK